MTSGEFGSPERPNGSLGGGGSRFALRVVIGSADVSGLVTVDQE